MPPLESLADILPNGITGRWMLADGTELIEGTIGDATHCYVRYYRDLDLARFILGDAAEAYVKDIFDDRIVFVGTTYWPVAVTVFPYLIEYRLSDWTRTNRELYMPMPASVAFGSPKADAHQLPIAAVAPEPRGVTIRFGSPSSGTDTDSAPSVAVHAIPEKYQIVVDFPGAIVQGGLAMGALPTPEGGLIQSVTLGESPGAGGVSVWITLDAAKWAITTYNCDQSFAYQALVQLRLYENASPTNLEPSIKR